ncbi:MAG: DegT/DnrJ/EryC1/StrS family aminotransferase [Chloroflexota bacterium]
MRVLPTSPTWLTVQDFRVIFGADKNAQSRVALQETLESELAAYFGRAYAILVASGTAGIYLTLKALAFSETSEVIVPAYTCIRVPNAIAASKLIPRFADVDETANMTVETVDRVNSVAACGLLLTHMYGNPAHVHELLDYAQQHNLTVIEDGCLTFGSCYVGKKCGTFGLASVFSLNRSKTVSAFGGGVVLTDDGQLANRVRMLRDAEAQPLSAQKRNALVRTILFNNLMFHPWMFGNVGKRLSRLNLLGHLNRPTQLDQISPIDMTALATIQLRLAQSQLQRADWFAQRRQQIAQRYGQGLAAIPHTTIKTTPEANPVWSHFSLILDSAESRPVISAALIQQGIQPGELFNYVCPLTHAYRDAPHNQADQFPQARRLAQRVINLPFYPYLSEADQTQVIAGVRNVLSTEKLAAL